MRRFLYSVLRNTVMFGWLLMPIGGQALANEQKILVLGDSISAAYGMSLDQGWVAQLASQLQKEYAQYQVVNASISGETTAGGLRRLPDLLQEHLPKVVIIELGGNDGLRGYPLSALQGNLSRMVTLAQEADAKVILLPMEIPPNYGPRYSTGFRESFKAVAKATNSTLAPFILDGFATDPKFIQDDGIHPTVAAQPLILKNVFPTITAVLAAL
jgi:acyl-CoA thioesterase-1